MRPALRIVVALALAAALWPARAHAYCNHGVVKEDALVYPWCGHTKYDFPVYLVDSDGLFMGFSVKTMEYQVKQAVDRWAEDAGANIHPYYGGITSSVPSLDVNDTFIIDTTDTSICGAFVPACTVTYSDACFDVNGAKIYFVDPPVPGAHWQVHDSFYNLMGTLLHELGHSWGLNDEYLDSSAMPMCEGTLWSSAMAENCGFDHMSLSVRDVGAIGDLYGQRDAHAPTEYFQSSDGGLSWSAGSPLSATGFLNRMGTAGSYSGVEIFSQPTFDPPGLWTMGVFRGVPGAAYTFQGVDTGSGSWDVSSTAVRDLQHYAFVQRSNELETDCRSHIRLTATQDGGLTHASLDLPAATVAIPSNEASEGVSLAYDPVSLTYVAAYLTSENHLVFNVVPTDLSASYPRTSTNYDGMDYPVVACGGRNYTGYDNCMVVWMGLDHTEPGAGYVRWAKGRVVTGAGGVKSFQMGMVYMSNIASVHAPALTFQPDAAQPYVMAIKDVTEKPVDILWSYRYSQAANQWVDQRLAASDPAGLLSPMLSYTGGRLILRTATLKKP